MRINSPNNPTRILESTAILIQQKPKGRTRNHQRKRRTARLKESNPGEKSLESRPQRTSARNRNSTPQQHLRRATGNANSLCLVYLADAVAMDHREFNYRQATSKPTLRAKCLDVGTGI